MEENQTCPSGSADHGEFEQDDIPKDELYSDPPHDDKEVESDTNQQMDDDYFGSGDSRQQTEDSNITQTFNNLEELQTHIFMNIRKENLKCNFCEVQLETRHLVLEHMKTAHAGKKIYLCALCDEMFQSHADLAVHSVEKHAL